MSKQSVQHAISLILVLGLAAFYLWKISTENNDTSQHDISRHYAEVFMNDFEMISMNDQGMPDYVLNGSHLQRYADSDDTEIRQPVIQLLQADKEWEIVADRAIINYKTETINLKKNVVMKQQNTMPAVTIQTDSLQVNTATQIAQTKARVDIKQGKSRLRSNGMVFNNATGELELSSSVNGHYSAHD